MSPKGRGNKLTPARVVELLKADVERTSQAATARATGLTLQTVQRYIKGIGEPTTATLQKIASYFGVSVAWLRGEGDFDVFNPDGTLNFNRVPSEAQQNGRTDLIQHAYQPAHKFDAETWLLCADAVETILNKEESREDFRKLVTTYRKKK